MYRIRQASRLTGVSEASLRAWERRYRVVVPVRTEAGYRLYDEQSIAAISTMRRLIEAGWAPGQAASAIRRGEAPDLSAPAPPAETWPGPQPPDAAGFAQHFLESAAAMDLVGMEHSLDGGFALGSFEHVFDSWLSPTLQALGDGWARGEIDVAAEHAASQAVHRRLSAAFEAAGTGSRGPAVVVGLPPGSQHELGALAFATALRRIGHHVLYLGADVPTASWPVAVEHHHALAAVLAVVTADDRAHAAQVAELLLETHPTLVVATGGAAGEQVATGARALPVTISDAAEHLDRLLPGNPA